MADNSQPDHPHVNQWIIAVAVMLSTFMEVLDTTVVNVSLPHIAGSLSATPDEATWALTSYLVANAIILPITGWLANYLGRKRLLMLSVTFFTAASFLCGLAPTLPMLIFFRLVQGASGGCLQPISQAVLLEAFKPEDRGKAMGFWGLGIVVAPMLGPVLGGWLTDNYSWRWVFYINVPIGIASLIMTRAFIFDPPYIRRSTSRIDYWGIGMLAVGVGALQLVLDKGQEKDWFSNHWILALTVVALACLAAFVIYELYAPHPVVNLRVFKNQTFSSGVFLMTALGFVLYGSLVLLPLLLQTLLGYPALQAGMAMAPRGLGSFLAMPTVGIIMIRFDSRKLLAFGIAVCAFTLWQLSRLNLGLGYWDIFWPQFIQGLSLAFLFVPLTTVTMDPISKEQMGNATSIFNLMRNLGGSMGIAAAATMSERWQQGDTNVLGAHFNLYDYGSQQMMRRLQQGFIAAGSDPVTALQRAYAAAFGMVERQAAMLAYNKVFLVLSMLFLIMIPFLFVMRRPQAGKGAVAH